MREQINNARPATSPGRTRPPPGNEDPLISPSPPTHHQPHHQRLGSRAPRQQVNSQQPVEPTSTVFANFPGRPQAPHLSVYDHHAPPPPNNPICTATCKRQRQRPARPAAEQRGSPRAPVPSIPKCLSLSLPGGKREARVQKLTAGACFGPASQWRARPRVWAMADVVVVRRAQWGEKRGGGSATMDAVSPPCA